MSEDKGYNGGPVKVRPHGWYSRISKRKHEQRLDSRCRTVYHSSIQPYFNGPVHVKTAEITEYLKGHTSGIPFFRAARAQNDGAQALLYYMKTIEIERILAQDYQPDKAVSIDPTILDRALFTRREIRIVNGQPVLIEPTQINPRDTFQHVGSLGFLINEEFVYDQRDAS